MAALVDSETGEVVQPNGSNGTARLNHITVRDRHRSDLGDLDALADSLLSVGMLQPIVVREEDTRLILVAGERRLEAARRLGWQTVPIRVVRKIKDAETALLAERDENTQRKAMTPTELKSLTDALLEFEKPAAKERQGTRTDIKGDRPEGSGQATDRAATAVGWSRRSYERVKQIETGAADESLPEQVRAVASDLLSKLTTGDITPNAAYDEYRDARVDAGLATSSERVATAKKRNPPTTALKVERAKEMAAKGYTSKQIADAIGIREDSMWSFRKRHGINVPADAVAGNKRRIDSNRIVEEAVRASGLPDVTAALIEYGELDRSRIDEWVSSLDAAIKSLQTLKRNLMKELTRA